MKRTQPRVETRVTKTAPVGNDPRRRDEAGGEVRTTKNCLYDMIPFMQNYVCKEIRRKKLHEKPTTECFRLILI